MVKNGIVILSVLIVLVISACTKGGITDDGSGDGGPHVINYTDTIFPVIQIFTPVSNQAFNSGSTISITGKLTDDLGLYRGSIKITNDATGEVVKNQLYEIHGFLSYDYSLNQSISVTAATDFTVTVSFEDHGLNSTTQSVKMKVNP